MNDHTRECDRLGEIVSKLGFRRTPRDLLNVAATDQPRVVETRENGHFVITVSGSDCNNCWQRAVMETELRVFLDSLDGALKEFS